MNQILNYSVVVNPNWAHQAFMKAYAGEWWRLWWLRSCGKNGRLINLNRLKKGLQTHIEAEVTSWLVDTNVYANKNRPELELEWQLLQRMRIF